MPIHAPLLFEKVDPLYKEKLLLALDNREREVNVKVGISKDEANHTLHQLRAMRAGLKLYQPEGSELQILARARLIRFYKEYDGKQPENRRHTVFMRIYATETQRPSELVAKAWEEYRAGRRSSPF
jgi:hypothetical protein